MKQIPIFLLMAGLFGLPCPGTGQETKKEITEIVYQIMSARKTSNELLPKYAWTSRTEVMRSKELLNMLIERNQYGPDGQVVQKLLNQEGAKMPTAFLIRKIAEDEKESMETFLYGMRDFLKKYTLQEMDQVNRFISAATWQVIDSTREFMFTGKDVEEPGDEMTWWVNDSRYSTSRIEVQTFFQGDAIHFTASFVTLPNGLNYMAYAEALVPAKNITLQIQNYDYVAE
jgi:hypothetical protein